VTSFLDALRAAHVPCCNDESCHGCARCYQLTGETVCQRTCQHADVDDFTEAEQDKAEAVVAAERVRVVECVICGDSHEVPADMQDGWVCDGCEARGLWQDEQRRSA